MPKTDRDLPPVTPPAPDAAPAAATSADYVPVESAARRVRAEAIVNKYAKWSAGLGLIPVPLLDLAAVSGAQYKMIRELADLYGVPASNDRVRSVVTVLLGGGLPALAGGSIGSAAKAIPVIGTLVGIAVMPALAGAAALALGRVFTAHFETGGVLLDLDTDALRGHFRRELEAARQEVPASAAPGVVTPEPTVPASPIR